LKDKFHHSIRYHHSILIQKTKNAGRSPYAAENDRRMNLKGLCLILRNFGRDSACLLKKYLILLKKSGFFF